VVMIEEGEVEALVACEMFDIAIKPPTTDTSSEMMR
jgi:hypothetical protein